MVVCLPLCRNYLPNLQKLDKKKFPPELLIFLNYAQNCLSVGALPQTPPRKGKLTVLLQTPYR